LNRRVVPGSVQPKARRDIQKIEEQNAKAKIDHYKESVMKTRRLKKGSVMRKPLRIKKNKYQVYNLISVQFTTSSSN